MRYAFESYTFDDERLTLRRYAFPIAIKPKTAQLLEYLLEHPGRLITKNEFMDSLWPNEEITEANLAQHIFLLRQIFSMHTPSETFILTVARRGYRFVAPVRTVSHDSHFQSPAWKLNVRGQYFLDQRTDEALKMALRAFEEAIEHDPTFGPAHSGIATTQVLRAQYLFAPPIALDQARHAALQAVSLDPRDLDAHLAIAEVALFRDWDYDEALKEYDHALLLDPGGSRVGVLRAWYFAILKEYDRSVHELELALRAKPYSLELLTNLGAIAMMRGSYGAAVEHCEYVLDMDPNYMLARYYRRAALAFGPQPEDSLRAFDEEAPYVTKMQQSLAIAGYAAARIGETARAKSILGQLREGAFQYVSPINIARVYVGLGDLDVAANAVRVAIDRRDPWAIFVPCDDILRTLPGIAHHAEAAGLRLPSVAETPTWNSG